MPTYQYKCTECDHAFEQFQSFSDDALTACPLCQGRLRKIFNAVGVVFKGSGFYRNDSRSGSDSDGNSKTDSTKSDTSASDGSTSASADTGSKPSSDSGKSDSTSSDSKSSSNSSGSTTASTKKD